MPPAPPSGVTWFLAGMACCCCCSVVFCLLYADGSRKQGDPTGDPWQPFLNGSYWFMYEDGNKKTYTAAVVLKDPAAHPGAPTRVLDVQPDTRILLVDAEGNLTGRPETASTPSAVTHAGVVATFDDFETDFKPLYLSPSRNHASPRPLIADR